MNKEQFFLFVWSFPLEGDRRSERAHFTLIFSYTCSLKSAQFFFFNNTRALHRGVLPDFDKVFCCGKDRPCWGTSWRDLSWPTMGIPGWSRSTSTIELTSAFHNERRQKVSLCHGAARSLGALLVLYLIFCACVSPSQASECKTTVHFFPSPTPFSRFLYFFSQTVR